MEAYNRAEAQREARAETRTPGGPRPEGRPTHDQLKAQYTRMIEYNARHFKGA